MLCNRMTFRLKLSSFKNVNYNRTIYNFYCSNTTSMAFLLNSTFVQNEWIQFFTRAIINKQCYKLWFWLGDWSVFTGLHFWCVALPSTSTLYLHTLHSISTPPNATFIITIHTLSPNSTSTLYLHTLPPLPHSRNTPTTALQLNIPRPPFHSIIPLYSI